MRELAAPRPGDVVLQKYLVEQVLGQGGMGVVLAARHNQLHQRVAIKVLAAPPAEAGEEYRRVLREARAAVQVASDHVARVLDFDTDEHGRPHIIMECLDGMDLAAVLRAHGPLPVVHAVGYLLHACEGLAAAHAAGIVHRDLKPANLFVTQRPDGSPWVKVLDFGISKMLSRHPAESDSTGKLVLGSVPHMSPEQLSHPETVDARADVWGLGSVLYELLAGTTAFSWSPGAASPPESIGNVVAAILTEPPRPLRERRPDVPAALEAVVMRCLEKSPRHRPASVLELAAALLPWAPPWALPARFLDGFAPRAATPSPATLLPGGPPHRWAAAVALGPAPTARIWLRGRERRSLTLEALVPAVALAAAVLLWQPRGESRSAPPPAPPPVPAVTAAAAPIPASSPPPAAIDDQPPRQQWRAPVAGRKVRVRPAAARRRMAADPLEGRK